MKNNPTITTRRGKIARLPAAIREQVCARLHDGQPGRVILPWLNSLPDVIKILATEFEGEPVTDQNLSTWRQTDFKSWLERRHRIERTKELSKYAAAQARADGQSIAEGAASIAAGKLLEALETIEEEEEDGKLSATALLQIASALTALRGTEQTAVKLQQDKERIAQKDQELALEREKFQHTAAGIALKLLSDDRARQIESGAGSNAEKIEQLGALMFPETWKPPGK
jgi:hypothetical protein